MLEEKINVLLINPHPIFCEGIKNLLETKGRYRVTTREGLPNTYFVQQPDLLLIDYSMFQQFGSILVEMMNNISHLKISILFNDESEVTNIRELLELKLYGYLIKDMDPISFLEAIDMVTNGKYYIHPKFTHYLIKEYYGEM